MSTVRSLGRGLELLDLLTEAADAPEGERAVAVGEMADALGVNKSSASRLARTLAEHGYLRRDPVSRRYILGPKMRHAASRRRAASALRERARPFLYLLMKQTGECAHTAVHARGCALIVDDVESTASLRVSGGVGRLNPLHCTAVGKVFLAFADVPPGEVLERRTEHTYAEHEALQRHLEATRRLGYAYDDEENLLGVRCLAAPVCDADGATVAAIGISGPTTRMTDAVIPDLAATVVDASRELSSILGRAPLSTPPVDPPPPRRLRGGSR